jgi:Ni,Fe-hydrogenase III large subunit
MFAVSSEDEKVLIFAVLAHDASKNLRIFSMLAGEKINSMVLECPQANLFEREIAEQFAIVFEGHPCFKALRFHHSYLENADAWDRKKCETIQPALCDFYHIEGSDVHEVAVGPVHAGIIEPGHFRFQCHGEEVFNLEIALGYQHRGIEKILSKGLDNRSIHLIETVSGDSTIGHGIAFVQALETLSETLCPPRAIGIRAILLELERIANHVGDLGALANDIAFLPTSSFCGRIRGDFLNLTALICGNRFGRRALITGGVAYDMDADIIADFRKKIKIFFDDATNAVELLFATTSVMSRFENCGTLSNERATELGIVGPVARASGLHRDIRSTHPFGSYISSQIPIARFDTEDVLARALVKYEEIKNSYLFILERLENLEKGKIYRKVAGLFPNTMAVSLVEGWRGEICHTVITDSDGRVKRYKIVDPSFHNWTGLELALRNEVIYNFPLCNKSFNLSYCGFDL